MGELNEAIRIFGVDQVKDSLKRGGREFDSEEDLQDEARDLADFLNSFGPTVEIFRAVHAKSPKQIDLDKLGNHWTHSEHKALDFARHELKKPWFLISAKVKHSDIDWAQTLFQNVHHPHEEELYVLKKVLNPQIKLIEGADLREYFGSLMLPDREHNYKVLQGIEEKLNLNVNQFVSAVSDVAKSLGFEKPGKAYFQCDAFSQAVRAVGESLGLPVKLYRADVQFRKTEGEIKQHEWIGHIFLKIGNMFYDFTARQFDPKSEFPLMMKTLDARYKNANAVPERMVGVDDDSAFYVQKLEKAFSRIAKEELGEWGIPATGFYSDKFNKI